MGKVGVVVPEGGEGERGSGDGGRELLFLPDVSRNLFPNIALELPPTHYNYSYRITTVFNMFSPSISM